MSDQTNEHRSTDADHDEWFNDWFASDFYLKLYSHRDHDEAEECIDLILRAIGFDEATGFADTAAFGGRSGAPRALDLAAGPARHAIVLARRGFDVTAVDLSPTLLDHARTEAAAAGVSIRFLQSDMRAIEYNREFDLGVQLFTSFGYFDDERDDLLVLKHMHNSLHQGGYYALDLMNERWLARNLVAHSERVFEDIAVIEDRWIADGRVNKRIRIPVNGQMAEFTESVRLYSPENIDRLLRTADLVPEKWFGDYDGSSYDSDDSKRMIIISRAT